MKEKMKEWLKRKEIQNWVVILLVVDLFITGFLFGGIFTIYFISI